MVARSGRTPASTNLLSSASPVRDGTHSLSRRATAPAFLGLVSFDFVAPFFGAISQIWMGTGVGSMRGCESGNVRAEDEDGMAEWQRWERGMQRRSYKELSPPFCILGFLENHSCDLRSSDFSDAA